MRIVMLVTLAACGAVVDVPKAAPPPPRAPASRIPPIRLPITVRSDQRPIPAKTAWRDGKLWVIEPDRGFGHVYDPQTAQWSELPEATLPVSDEPFLRLEDHVRVGADFAWDGRAGTIRGRAISAVDAPSPRTDPPVQIWTGHTIFVWGGRAGTSQLRDGARYDVVTDTWAPMAESERPLSAFRWTGRYLIASYEASSGLTVYDPDADRWRPVAAPRELVQDIERPGWILSPTTLMFVNLSRTAAVILDLSRNAWRIVLLDPSPRHGRVTVHWTGTHLVLFGGWNHGKVLEEGSRCEHVEDRGCDPIADVHEVTIFTDGAMYAVP